MQYSAFVGLKISRAKIGLIMNLKVYPSKGDINQR